MPIHLPPISRRRFLKSTLAAGAALLVPGRTDAAQQPVDPNRFVLLADVHVWSNRDEPFNKVKPADNLQKVCREVIALSPRPANMIVAGDCAQIKGMPGDYAVLKNLLDPVRRAGIAVHLCLGNHDHRANFYAAFPNARPSGSPPVRGKHAAILQSSHANFVLLDSLETTNATPGLLGKAQLGWLAHVLDAHKDRPALAFAHHDPNFGKRKSGLRDTDALLKLLQARRHVAAYVYGHTHAWGHKKAGDLHLMNVPTTAWLFNKKQPRGWVDARLRADGAKLVLNALDKKHAAHGEQIDLTWRA